MTKINQLEVCPRCKRKCLENEDVLNSISHIDNKTLVCPECGKQSGMCDMNLQQDPAEIEMHERFKRELEK